MAERRMSSATERDWYRRIPRDPVKTRRAILVLALVVTAVIVYILIWTWLREVSLRLSIIWQVLFHLGWLLPSFQRINSKSVAAQSLKQVDSIPHIEGDQAVDVVYRYKGWSLGMDSGYVGLRKEGVSFNGLQTSFLVKPEELEVEFEKSEFIGRFLHIKLPSSHPDYVIVVTPIRVNPPEDEFDAAAELRSLIFADAAEAPSSAIFNPPPMTPSPYEREAALFAPKFFYGAATLVPLLLIGGYVWWAINLSDQMSKTFFVGFLLVLLLLALLVVAVRDVWPSIERTRKLVVDLENRARGTLSGS